MRCDSMITRLQYPCSEQAVSKVEISIWGAMIVRIHTCVGMYIPHFRVSYFSTIYALLVIRTTH